VTIVPDPSGAKRTEGNVVWRERWLARTWFKLSRQIPIKMLAWDCGRSCFVIEALQKHAMHVEQGKNSSPDPLIMEPIISPWPQCALKE